MMDNGKEPKTLSSMSVQTKTTVIVKLAVDAMHNFPLAAELFPEVAFLADRHRHMFHFTVSKVVNHDDRDVEFIMFKRDLLHYLEYKYYKNETRTHEFGPRSCEMLAREILDKFDCEWVEVWEDYENGAKVEKV
jgi:hypothetical protein